MEKRHEQRFWIEDRCPPPPLEPGVRSRIEVKAATLTPGQELTKKTFMEKILKSYGRMQRKIFRYGDTPFSWVGQLSMRRVRVFQPVSLAQLCLNFQLEFLTNLTNIF